MDKNRESTTITAVCPRVAQLWVGNQDNVITRTVLFLQKFFCKKECSICCVCSQIKEKQYHAITWLAPEKNYYTISQLEAISQKIAYQLNPNENHFFVIQKADFLTTACANSLLKSIEEPPPGYHFILLAQYADRILPTILSRCIIKTFQSQQQITTHPLLSFFTTNYANTNPKNFLSVLQKSAITESQSIELIDTLFSYWMQQYKKAVSDKQKQQQILALQLIGLIKKMIDQPPMPGSSKLFWKNLFLNFKDQRS